ncbi:MAG: hypothetical protein P1U56_23745 [Saprospiraceae bacterium]|nr:hypothetical protein [Saprospiraceae bacterium]
MAMSKAEKRNAARKIAEAKSKARKADRETRPQASSGGKTVKGKKSLGSGKKK